MNERISIIVIILLFLMAVNGSANKIYHIEPKDIDLGDCISFEGSTIYLLSDTLYSLKIAEINNTEKFNNKPYPPIDRPNINGTLKISKDNELFQEIEPDGDRYKVKLDAGDYTIWLEKEGKIEGTDRRLLVIKGRTRISYIIDDQYSESIDDILYTVKYQHIIFPKLVKGVDTVYFYQMVCLPELIGHDPEKWKPISDEEPKADLRLQVSMGDKTENYDLAEYYGKKGYQITLNEKGLYKIRLHDATGYINGTGRDIKVIDIGNGVIPLFFAVIPLLVGIIITLKRR